MSERPLSPHLQIYRLPLTAILSITHRITGVFLSAGSVLWVMYLMAVAQGGASFAQAQALLNSFLGWLFLWGWIFALYFHLCHGIRHLVWDTVYGLERDTLMFQCYVELGATVLLTLITLIAA
jgi:succinate dehydrogenase / fumarate reductase cytochrome b subunit